MRNSFCVFAALCLINISMVSSQGFLSPKKCAEFNLVPVYPFIKELYIGQWFMHQMYELPGTEDYECYVLITTQLPNEYSATVIEILINDDLPKRRRELISEGVGTISSDGKGIITFTSPEEPEYNGFYYIIGTDYFTYAVEASCKDVDGGSVIQLYIKSRLPIVLSFTQKKIDDVIKASKLDPGPIRTLDITSCPAKLLKGATGGGLLGGLLRLVTALLKLVTGLVTGLLGGLSGGLLGGLLG